MMRKGDRFVMPLARTTTYPLIGAVALHWGDLETLMDRLLATFVAADADPNDEHWERLGFEKRRKKLKEKARVRFPGLISDEIDRILDAAAVYHWQRNIVIHGHFSLSAKDGVATTHAKGTVNRVLRSMIVTDDHLERLYHEISFLAGRIADLTCSDKGAGGCWLSWRNRSKLRAFVKRYCPSRPTPKKIEPRHPPLRDLSLPAHLEWKKKKKEQRRKKLRRP